MCWDTGTNKKASSHSRAFLAMSHFAVSDSYLCGFQLGSQSFMSGMVAELVCVPKIVLGLGTQTRVRYCPLYPQFLLQSPALSRL